MTENRKVMANNIKRLMAAYNTNATEICKLLDIKQNTFSDWINAKSYPRIDKIELLANYFHVNKSVLVEEHSGEESEPLNYEEQKVVKAYRVADDGTKTAVCKLLDIERGAL